MLKRRDGSFIVLFFLFLGLTLFLQSCSKQNPAKQMEKPPVLVAVATVIKKTVPVELRAVGNVEAYSTVGVKAQTGGELIRVHFREGQDVSKGDLLFTIDPRPYEAALKQAEANLAKDTAQMEYAREQADRYEKLVKKGYVAKEQYEQFRTNAAALEATVNADMAAVENARIQLSYCFIHSPITGRTGSLIVNEGNLIKANADTPMVTIHQNQPIYVTFSVPEQYLNEIKRYMSAGKLTVKTFISNEDVKPEQGVLTFIDNTVNIDTGTIKLKATFTNKEKRLWPGQFVNVVITLTSQPDAVVVPSQAIQTGQAGQYVFVIKDDQTVESRSVVVVRTVGDEAVVGNGLKPGEKVVTDGQLRLVPGAKVEIKGAV